jgi:alpha-glucuronidase
MKHVFNLFCTFFLGVASLSAQTGYDLWLGFSPLPAAVAKSEYGFVRSVYLAPGQQADPVMQNTASVLSSKLSLMLSREIRITDLPGKSQIQLLVDTALQELNPEGYLLAGTGQTVTVKGRTPQGVLYGALELVKRVKTQQPIKQLQASSNPKVQLRVLNHWDNLDRTVERGYAGFSIFNWHELPEVMDPRYEDYALANASVGINGTVVTNVNANALILRDDYLDKVAALADLFRKYGIRTYLTARFSAPIEMGKLPTADPLDPAVAQWWKDRVAAIYQKIPDFGGFVVKANSEGQPGPQDYQRNHAEGANMLAEALAPFGGIVMWRAFVYDPQSDDRFKQAYDEFHPLDGKFAPNVLVQVKNGPIDFQPREPISPLLGTMEKTPVMLELQITKEYLGQGTHLVGLANMFAEVLQTDTHAKGPGSEVAKVVDGSLFGYALTGMAGVANIGTAFNWTGNFFGQADWYAFGRLAWDPYLSAQTIFEEWTALTFSQPQVRKVAVDLLNRSHQACIDYMTPLGLHHIMAEGHHYGPGPWVDRPSRPDWTSIYYHRANKTHIGFDRTAKGTHALAQYHPGLQQLYLNPDTCPEDFLLWFHHVPWERRMQSGKSLWEELIARYEQGVATVEYMHQQWDSVRNLLDEPLYQQVASHLQIQRKEARWWRDACLAYFQSVNQLPYPQGVKAPPHNLDYYKNLSYPYAPGINPRW